MPTHAKRSSALPYVWAAVAVVLVLCAVALLALLLEPHKISLKTGVILPQPKALIDFHLQSADGHPFTNTDLHGHWTLIFTGYTHCPDVCPTTLAGLSQVVDKLGTDKSRLRILFISVDPRRDSPHLLLNYVHAFNPAFTGATGSQAQLKALGRNLGFAYSYEPSIKGNPDNYVVNHSAGIMLINPQAQLDGFFSPPIEVSAMAADLRQVIDGDGA